MQCCTFSTLNPAHAPLQRREVESVAAVQAVEDVVRGLERLLGPLRDDAERFVGEWIEGKQLLQEQHLQLRETTRSLVNLKARQAKP